MLQSKGDFAREIKFARETRTLLRREGWRRLMLVSFNLEKSIKVAFTTTRTVDTGRARASWGHWTPGLLVPGKKNQARARDAFFRSSQKDLTSEQGTNVDYVPQLEASHPRFAGSIAEAEKLHIAELERLLVDLVNSI